MILVRKEENNLYDVLGMALLWWQEQLEMLIGSCRDDICSSHGPTILRISVQNYPEIRVGMSADGVLKATLNEDWADYPKSTEMTVLLHLVNGFNKSPRFKWREKLPKDS